MHTLLTFIRSHGNPVRALDSQTLRIAYMCSDGWHVTTCRATWADVRAFLGY